MTISKRKDIYNIIGSNIKRYRKEAGLTQHQLADKIPVSDSFVAKLESITHQTISIDMLERFAEVLKKELYLFFIDHDKDI
ncbi:MAG: helix-turn-helix domain-containing protein [Firmicutes bacterium]|nr:helix-turn-helix domain-containing protein [Bacillota bacterium]